MDTIASVCTYCGCGCRLLFQVESGRIVKIVPDRTDNPSEGTACIKGLTIHESVGKGEGRVLKPLMRMDKDEEFKEASWDEAYRFIHEYTKDLAPSEVFINASGKMRARTTTLQANLLMLYHRPLCCLNGTEP